MSKYALPLLRSIKTMLKSGGEACAVEKQAEELHQTLGEEKPGGAVLSLNVYDLSNGLAKQLSMSLIGRQIDGVWHTGLVAYGKEYYFGSGISRDLPGKTPFGVPVKTLELGRTTFSEAKVMEALKKLQPKYTAESYDLFKNNCNHFTDEVARALLGRGIPEQIVSLPEDFVDSPLGASLMPVVQ